MLRPTTRPIHTSVRTASALADAGALMTCVRSRHHSGFQLLYAIASALAGHHVGAPLCLAVPPAVHAAVPLSAVQVQLHLPGEHIAALVG